MRCGRDFAWGSVCMVNLQVDVTVRASIWLHPPACKENCFSWAKRKAKQTEGLDDVSFDLLSL